MSRLGEEIVIVGKNRLFTMDVTICMNSIKRTLYITQISKSCMVCLNRIKRNELDSEGFYGLIEPKLCSICGIVRPSYYQL